LEVVAVVAVVVVDLLRRVPGEVLEGINILEVKHSQLEHIL